jgi:hypothetical protein
VDLSPEYVRMCREAKEIQELIQVGQDYQEGDWYEFTTWKEEKAIRMAANDSEEGIDERLVGEVWFPRQDQLQDMIKEGNYTLYWLVNGFANHANRLLSMNYGRFSSLEQLWLAFTMKTLFSKEWTGEDWE